MNINQSILSDTDYVAEHLKKFGLARLDIYNKLGLTETQRAIIEEMVRSSPSRKIGKNALTNVITEIYSIKNLQPLILESHTCELIYFYLLELNSDILYFCVQVPCPGIERYKNDKKHVSNATLDFLVFRKDSITLVECKYQANIDKLIAKGSDDWVKSENGYKHISYENWAIKNGIFFEVWVQNPPIAIWHQNLDACYQFINVELSQREEKTAAAALKAIKSRPRNLTFLKQTFKHFSGKLALWLIANGHCFSALRSTSIVRPDEFILYASKIQADEIDNINFKALNDQVAQPIIGNTLLLASQTDIKAAEARLARLERIKNGQEPETKRMTELKLKVDAAEANNVSALEAALTTYSTSGNREDRLNVVQREVLDTIVRKYWNKGKTNTQIDLWFHLDLLCKDKNVSTPSISFLCKHLKKLNPQIRALGTGGLRKFQSIAPRTENILRSNPALCYGHTLHIDSSKLDIKCAPNILTNFPMNSPLFYVGIDEATEIVMTHALIFGSARTDGLAILLRRYVRKHGCLPARIFMDRGTENRSKWIRQFAHYFHIIITIVPTAASRFNSLAENIINHVNSQVSHKFPGSTDPDKAGRKVDGHFKSYKNAKVSFIEISKHFKDFIYHDHPIKPDDSGERPIDKKNELMDEFGMVGKPCEYNDDFLIQTSIILEVTKNQCERHGIRTGDGYFTSTELQFALRTNSATEIRSDCIDPNIMYVKVGRKWYKAFGKYTTKHLQMSDDEKLFHLLIRPEINKTNRQQKLAIKKTRFDRHQAANEARESNEDIDPNAVEPTNVLDFPSKNMAEPICENMTGFSWDEIPDSGDDVYEF